MRVFLAVFFCISITLAPVRADDRHDEGGDPAVAERYVIWVEEAIAAGQWAQARAALQRASDFSNVSSDISYLLALAMFQGNEGRGRVLAALEEAIATGLWTNYSEAQARFFQAELLVAMRHYFSALDALAVREALIGDDADSAVLRLAALKGLVLGGAWQAPPDDPLPDNGLPVNMQLPGPAEFRQRMLETMDRYPRDTRPLRLFFHYIRWQEPTADDSALMELALRRLPFLLESDPELAWMAAPFILDVEEARRLVAAYRSGSLLHAAGDFSPSPASIAPALNLGLLEDIDAVDELFINDILDKGLVVSIGSLLRSEEGRDHLARNLHSFTGVVSDDEDRDGIMESRALFRQGALLEYHYDINQDGLVDMSVWFDSGVPWRAELPGLPETGGAARASIQWERYPLVQNVVLGDETFLFAPGGFAFSPIRFEELCATETYSGLFFPQLDPLNPGISRRMLSSAAVFVQRPSAEFAGGIEHIHLDRGIPLRAEVILDGITVSVTLFENGIPVSRRIGFDGRLETIDSD